MPYPRPGRPHFREPHPVRLPALAAGAGAAAVWFLLFAFVWGGAVGYAWLTILAGVVAALAAGLLALRGDRGVAVGIALVAGFALAAAGVVLTTYWVRGDWLLW
ncbi:hypothetical protein Lfu02_21510 [Longispora fulva]|nr:hypothetical protein Lfu02_21510 [Longispora fulva]